MKRKGKLQIKPTAVTYVPDADDPLSVKWRGHTFRANTPKMLTDARLIEAAKGNRFFRVGRFNPGKDVATNNLAGVKDNAAEHQRAAAVVRNAIANLPSDDVALIATRDLVVKLLNNVHRAFSEEPDLPHTVGNDRERLAVALFHVARFFANFHVPFADRFFELGSALADLNLGVRHDLMTPAVVDNRRSDSSQMWRARARVALALDALVRSGQPLRDAAAKIARDHPHVMQLVRAKRDRAGLTDTIIDWRKKFRAGRLKNWEGLEFFAIGKEWIEKTSAPDILAAFARDQLTAAIKFCGALSPNSKPLSH